MINIVTTAVFLPRSLYLRLGGDESLRRFLPPQLYPSSFVDYDFGSVRDNLCRAFTERNKEEGDEEGREKEREQVNCAKGIIDPGLHLTGR